MAEKRIVVLVGASGLVGGHVLRVLLEDPDYAKVVLLVRRAFSVGHPKVEQHLCDFERIEEAAAWIQGDELFYCLGTTRKKAGSAEAFIHIDFGYAERVARIAAANGMGKFLLVSSTGANASSRLLYPRVKGELEAAVSSLPFREVHIFRPSFLAGDRDESRPLESLMIGAVGAVARALPGLLKRVRPVRADAVARAMVAAAKGPPGGARIRIHESEGLV